MKWLLNAVLLVLVSTCVAQEPRNLRRGVPGVPGAEEPSTNNYQLELRLQRRDKSATYVVAFNGGQITTELIDRTVEKSDLGEPRMLSFSANFRSFQDESGGEVSIHLGRSLPYRVRAQVQGAPPGTEREVTQLKSIGFTTKVALTFGKPVVVFSDGEEKITLTLAKAAD